MKINTLLEPSGKFKKMYLMIRTRTRKKEEQRRRKDMEEGKTRKKERQGRR